jgi:hypothetical protein
MARIAATIDGTHIVCSSMEVNRCSSRNSYSLEGAPMASIFPWPVPLCEGLSVNGDVIVVEQPEGSRRRVLTHPTPIRNSSGAVVGAVNSGGSAGEYRGRCGAAAAAFDSFDPLSCSDSAAE